MVEVMVHMSELGSGEWERKNAPKHAKTAGTIQVRVLDGRIGPSCFGQWELTGTGIPAHAPAPKGSS